MLDRVLVGLVATLFAVSLVLPATDSMVGYQAFLASMCWFPPWYANWFLWIAGVCLWFHDRLLSSCFAVGATLIASAVFCFIPAPELRSGCYLWLLTFVLLSVAGPAAQLLSRDRRSTL